MMQLVRIVMSLTCVAAAGGIVYAHQAKRSAGEEPSAFLHGLERLDELVEELSGPATEAGDLTIDNDYVRRLARERWETHRDDMMIFEPGEPVAAKGRAERDNDVKSRTQYRPAYRAAGGSKRPGSLWDRSRWRDHTKMLDYERRYIKTRKLNARSRVGQDSRNFASRVFGSSAKSHFERSRRYAQVGSRYKSLQREVNRALRR